MMQRILNLEKNGLIFSFYIFSVILEQFPLSCLLASCSNKQSLLYFLDVGLYRVH